MIRKSILVALATVVATTFAFVKNTQAEELITLPAKELAEGWISLFDGKTLYGWAKRGEANFRVEDGAIVVDEGEVCLLCTTTQFDNYELKFEFKAETGTNSGVFLRTSPSPKNPATECYEFNIAAADNPFPTGSLVGREKSTKVSTSGEWQEVFISIKGGEVSAKIGDVTTVTYTDEKPLGKGFIGLQHNSGKVAFRNIRLRPIHLKPLLNGKDLTGWKTHPELVGEFAITPDGELSIKGGRGQLETTDHFANFVLQMEFKTLAEHLNSGLFFRCIPGDVMMGYESQIHQGYQDEDRTKPIDHGTGGIFRRQNARQVVGDDLEWVHKTLICDGNHIAAWVNGLQVSDWNDRRKPDANPRKGYRAAAGSLMLQAHDPTTDLLFRNIRAREMSPRR